MNKIIIDLGLQFETLLLLLLKAPKDLNTRIDRNKKDVIYVEYDKLESLRLIRRRQAI